MKILFALNHPAHYYLFKYVVKGLEDKGHKVFIVIKDKDILEKLLIEENIEYFKLSHKRKVKSPVSIISKGSVELFIRDFRLLNFVKKNKPEILIGTDIAITHVGKLLRIPSIVFNEDDYEINKIFCKLSYPFASWIVAPEYTSVGFHENKKISYNGIQKMAYLNPKYFIPDNSILKKMGLVKNDKFFIIRLVSLTSGHDIEGKHKGIDIELLKKLVTYLEKHGKIFITSEERIPKDLSKYLVKMPINKMQDLMYYSNLFIGDSQTMCAEAGILGTPFIRFNDFVGKIEYLNDLENNYKLGWGVKTDNPKRVFSIIDELFNLPNYKKEWIKKKDMLFTDKVDLTALSIWLIEHYPTSVKTLKENPDYQYNFK